MELLFASHNLYKKNEMQMILSNSYILKNLKDIGIHDEIPETGKTLEENALIKVRYLHRLLNVNCFAEDSGLEIDYLNGAPGVYSARYAGNQKKDEDNLQLVLEQMKHTHQRNARFRTIIALILDGKEYLFEGIVKGVIAFTKTGTHGFGYDPIFIPENFNKTFAELGTEFKSKISHRSIAVLKLVEFLNTQK